MNNIDTVQVVTVIVMAVFYIAYFAKQIRQQHQGIDTMILGKGDKPESQKKLETILKIATCIMPAIELFSIWWSLVTLPVWLQWGGVVIAAIGVWFFIASILTMKGNWRAGVPDKKETSLVTTGIYSISRNPAFVGFDLMYLGIVIAFPNAWHACAAAFTAWLFHKQIKSEEVFLETAFGKEYLEYKNKVRRYI